MGAKVVEGEARDALWGLTENGRGSGADSVHVIGAGGLTGLVAGFGIAASDVRAGTEDEWFGWRTGPDAAIGEEVERRKGWADVVGGAER